MQLIGRTKERDMLHRLVRSAKQSDGQAVSIVGDAGIGKTRLLASLVSLAEMNGFAVIRGECLEQDQDFPYAPIIDGLRAYFSGMGDVDLHRIVDPFQPEIIKLLPELVLQFDDIPTSTPLESEAEKRRLFEVLVQIYQRVADSGLLLIFEDVHWCDVISLEFFQTLTRRISELPVMVAFSSRPTTPDHPAGRLQQYLERAENARTILLHPLSEEEVEDLTKNVLQTTDAIHPGLLDKLVKLVQGNPLYTEQIVYLLLQNRQINLVNSTWMVTSSTRAVEIPTSIKQMVLQQMERLSDEARQILRLAAVAGRQFELGVIQSLTGFEDVVLTDVIKEAIRLRLLEEVSRNHFAFRHALLRQAIYDDLLIHERQNLHQSLLHIIEGSESIELDTRLTDLSYHAYQAEAWEAALRYGFRAGQHATSLHSPRAATEHFSHAVEAANKLGDQASWELYMQRGQAYDNLGEFQQAVDDYELALQASKRSGDQPAAWETLIAIALLWSARDYQRAEEFCKRALALAQSMEEPELIGHSLNRLGNWFLNAGEPHEALDYHERALAVFEELGDLAGKGETLDLLGMTHVQVLHFKSAREHYQEAAAIFRELDDRKALASTLTNLAANSLDLGLGEEAVDIAHQIGWYSGEAYACTTLGLLYAYQGHFAESLSYVHRGLELARAIDHTHWLAAAHVFGAFIYKEMLELAIAADYVEKGVKLATEVGSQWYIDTGTGLLASILIEQQELEAAQELLAHSPASYPPTLQQMALALAEMELSLARGLSNASLSLLEQFRDMFLETMDSGTSAAMAQIPYMLLRARALALLDRSAEAREVLQQARRICDKWGLLPSLWRAEILSGEVADDESNADQHFRQARIVIKQLADQSPEELRQRFLSNAEKLIPSARRIGVSTGSRHDLTPREVDVVREVALGKTNQQIADDLHITVKTVEAHITRALSKLDLTSRTQIALWAVENKLMPPSEGV